MCDEVNKVLAVVGLLLDCGSDEEQYDEGTAGINKIKSMLVAQHE